MFVYKNDDDELQPQGEMYHNLETHFKKMRIFPSVRKNLAE